MGELVLPTELVVGALLALVLLVAVATYARRRAIARGEPLVVCAVRDVDASRWRLGLARYGQSGLDWFTLAGISIRPARRWARSSLEIGPPRSPARGDRLDILPDAVVVTCAADGSRFDLALAPGPHTALRSWVEASPPGEHLHVA